MAINEHRDGGNGHAHLHGALLSPARVGDANRSLVLQALCDNGPLSRADLAKMAGVTRATIGNIAQTLLDSGLIEERAPDRSAGKTGKPARPLWFAPGAGLSGAVALGRGVYEVALVDARGELLDAAEGEFDPDEPSGRAIESGVVAGLKKVLPKAGDGLLGIGIVVPGVCDTSIGLVLGSGQLPGLHGTSLVEAVERRFGHRVLVDNDARTQALGEKWFGLGRGLTTFVSVQTGHGLGVGLVLNGTVFRGQRGYTGELGHTCVAVDGERCACGRRGCWETIATLRWMRREAAQRGLPNAARIDSALLAEEVAAGSPGAVRLMADYAASLAVGLANLTNLLYPELIVLHGDVLGGGDHLRSLIEEATRDRVLPYLHESVRVALSPFDQRAGLLGAAGLVLSETFSLVT